jgi:hypothetical protein
MKNWQDRQGCSSFVAFVVGALIIAAVAAIFFRRLGLW